MIRVAVFSTDAEWLDDVNIPDWMVHPPEVHTGFEITKHLYRGPESLAGIMPGLFGLIIVHRIDDPRAEEVLRGSYDAFPSEYTVLRVS